MIIAFTGKMGSGKDTCATLLCKNLCNHKRMMFAGHLKNVTKIAFKWTDDHVNGSLKDVTCPYWGVTPRYVLQTLGTDYLRNYIDENYHTKIIDLDIKQYIRDGYKSIILTDLRFPNEANYVKENGGIIIKVDRPGLDGVSSHQSESHDIIPNITILNDGDEKDLKVKIDYLFLRLNRGENLDNLVI